MLKIYSCSDLTQFLDINNKYDCHLVGFGGSLETLIVGKCSGLESISIPSIAGSGLRVRNHIGKPMERICEADGCGIDFSRLRALEKAASKMILVDYWIFVHEANADYKGYAMFALAQEGHCRPREVLQGTDSTSVLLEYLAVATGLALLIPNLCWAPKAFS
ncbi:hypothetical protein ACH5RR_032844 [Cinchona calisaya]|uniref:Uncharacterized protein n=1 Tax=Cinchona calisaya TaxID=153742 RepID=A0ABD2YJ90_9GENT